MNRDGFQQLNRRTLLRNGTLLLAAGATFGVSDLLAREWEQALRVGLVTDLPYADKPPHGTRHYRARWNDGPSLVMVAISSLTMLVLTGVLGGLPLLQE